jgi:hypothetical protein
VLNQLELELELGGRFSLTIRTQHALPLANMSPHYPDHWQYPCVESIANYRKGGFHPIHLDDILHNRYRIAHKLGYGSYATIWLVEDLNSGRYAALKVLSANVSKDLSEAAILRHLKLQRQLNDGGSNGQEFLIEFLDDFKVEGPNGTHQCIVTEVLGPSVAADVEEIYGEELYPIEIAKKVCAQVIRGVAYLHSCGVVHGGKLSDPLLEGVLLISYLQTSTLETYSFAYLGLSRCLVRIYKSTWENQTKNHSPAEMANQLHPLLTNQSM